MPDKDCVISIITQFLSKNFSKYNEETTVDLTLGNRCRAEQAIIIFMPGKV